MVICKVMACLFFKGKQPASIITQTAIITVNIINERFFDASNPLNENHFM